MASQRRVERRIECGRDCCFRHREDAVSSTGAENVLEIVEDWNENGYVFNVLSLFYEDDPEDYVAGETRMQFEACALLGLFLNCCGISEFNDHLDE